MQNCFYDCTFSSGPLGKQFTFSPTHGVLKHGNDTSKYELLIKDRTPFCVNVTDQTDTDW